MSLRLRVQRVASLEAQEWRALADGVLAAVRIELGLRTRSLGTVIAWAESRPARRSHDQVDGQRLLALSAWPYRAVGVSPSCLQRSLVLTALLRQRRRYSGGGEKGGVRKATHDHTPSCSVPHF